MFSHRARSELRAHHDQLERWRRSVPERARRFHGACEDLDQRIRTVLGRWWQLWIGQDELARVRDQVSRLRDVAGGLTVLGRSAEKLETEARQLAEQAATVGDPEVAAWLAGRAREWLIRVERVGGNCDRRSELFHDEQILSDVESALRLHSEAIYWLKEAGDVLARLGSDPHAAELAVTLPELERALIRSGATPEWLENLRAKVKPLKDRAAERRDPPPELHGVATLLTEVRRWSRQLGELEDQVLELGQDHGHLVAVDWKEEDREEVRDVLRRAEELRSELLARAREVRRGKLERLEQGMLDLFQACGPQPGLEKDLEGLERSHQAVREHHQQAEWLRLFRRADDRFRGLAETQQIELEARLLSQVGKLRQGFEELRRRPLSDDVRKRADAFEHDVEELARARGAQDILGGLRRAAAVERDLAELERQAGEDLRDLAAARAELGERNVELQDAARRVELELRDLASEIEALSAVSDPLDETRAAARRLGAELEAERRRLVERCRELGAQWGDQVRAAASALRRAGRTPAAELAELRLEDDAGPRPATDFVGELQELAAGLRALAGEEAGRLDERRREAGAELESLGFRDLSPGDREDAEQLRAEVGGGSWSLAEDDVERLRLLARLVEKCELFFRRLRQEELDAEQHLASLRRRLRSFDESQLRRYVPELAERVSALIYGIPERPGRWPVVRRQLGMAAELFGRLELQAARLAARDVERASRALRRQLRGVGGERREEIEELLAELEACGHDRLPPVTLRMKLWNAAPRWQEGGR